MDWNLDELRSFVLLARELHFGRTAEGLSVSQPALSKQIQRLEEKVNGRLFVRSRRRVGLTETGRVLLPLAEGLLRQSGAAFAMVREANAGNAGTLHIGYGLAAIAEILPRTILKFRRKYPLVRLQLKDMSTSSQEASLVDGTLDIGFLRLPVRSPNLDSLSLIRERLVLALPKSFPQKRRLSDWREGPFVLLSRAASATFHDHAISICRRAGFTPNIVQEANETFAVLNLVRAGLGVSLVQSAASKMNVPSIGYHEL